MEQYQLAGKDKPCWRNNKYVIGVTNLLFLMATSLEGIHIWSCKTGTKPATGKITGPHVEGDVSANYLLNSYACVVEQYWSQL